MELADMRDLGSRAARRAGSTPVTRTTSEETYSIPLPWFPKKPGKLHIRKFLLPFQIEPTSLGFDLGGPSRIGVMAARLTLTQEAVVRIHDLEPYMGLIQR